MTAIERHVWAGEGYRPLVQSDGWQVALLRREPAIEPGTMESIERHKASDEVFVLVRGRAFLFARRDGETLMGEDLEPGVVYNIPRGVWHNLLATPDVSLLIVENRGTDRADTEIRPLTAEESVAIQTALPDWLQSGSAESNR